MKKSLVLSLLTVLCLIAMAFAAPAKASPAPVIVAVQGMMCQSCADGLQKDLAKLPGVTALKVNLSTAQVTAQLDEAKTPASAFVHAIAAHPRFMDPKKNYGAMLVIYIDAPMCAKEKVMCPACPPEITKMLKANKGVNQISLDKTGKIASVTFTNGASVTTQELANALAKSTFKFSVSFAGPVKMK